LITHEDFSKIESTESLLKKFLYMPWSLDNKCILLKKTMEKILTAFCHGKNFIKDSSKTIH
jgi:hypothetical protein